MTLFQEKAVRALFAYWKHRCDCSDAEAQVMVNFPKKPVPASQVTTSHCTSLAAAAAAAASVSHLQRSSPAGLT